VSGARPLLNGEISSVSKHFRNQRDRALYFLGLGTGLRISELLSLRVRNIIDKSGKIQDMVYVPRSSMKGKIEGRSIPLSKRVAQHLLLWIVELEKKTGYNRNTFIFQSRKGANCPISRKQASRILCAAFEAAGLKGKLSTHSLRKTFAAKIHQLLGNDYFKTSKALGHKDPSSTVYYLRFQEEEINSAIRNVLNEEDQMDLFE